MGTREENRMQWRRLRRVGLVVAATLAMGSTAGVSGTAFARGGGGCNPQITACGGGGFGGGGGGEVNTKAGNYGGGGFTIHYNSLGDGHFFCTAIGSGRSTDGCVD
jgi:hypothetical protein